MLIGPKNEVMISLYEMILCVAVMLPQMDFVFFNQFPKLFLKLFHIQITK